MNIEQGNNENAIANNNNNILNNSFGSNNSFSQSTNKNVFSEIKQEMSSKNVRKESQEMTDIKNTLIYAKIDLELRKLIKLINYKLKLHKLCGFTTMKLHNKNSPIQIANSILIVSKIKYNLYTLLNIYKHCRLRKKLGKFVAWKSNVRQFDIRSQIKGNLKEEITKKLDKELKEQHYKIKEKEKELEDYKGNLTKLTNIEMEQKKKMKAIEEKEQKYIQIINKLEVNSNITFIKADKKNIQLEIGSFDIIKGENQSNFEKLKLKVILLSL